MIYNLHLGLLV